MKHCNCKIIGLTGGIASGKSTVSNILLGKGFKIIDADKVARSIMNVDMPAYIELVNLFGESILKNDKSIDRKALGDKVFSQESLLKKLNQITHPKIYEEIAKEVSLNCKNHKAIFIDLPLLFEELVSINKHNIYFDEIWLVYVDKEQQLERLMKRNNLGKDTALKRIELQISMEEKKKKASRIIDNRRSLRDLKQQIDIFVQSI